MEETGGSETATLLRARDISGLELKSRVHMHMCTYVFLYIIIYTTPNLRFLFLFTQHRSTNNNLIAIEFNPKTSAPNEMHLSVFRLLCFARNSCFPAKHACMHTCTHMYVSHECSSSVMKGDGFFFREVNDSFLRTPVLLPLATYFNGTMRNCTCTCLCNVSRKNTWFFFFIFRMFLRIVRCTARREDQSREWRWMWLRYHKERWTVLNNSRSAQTLRSRSSRLTNYEAHLLPGPTVFLRTIHHLHVMYC